MTKTDIKTMAHLKVNEEVEGKFRHVHVEDGYMLTSWNEEDDIKEYQGFECLYMPIADEYVDFRVITLAQHKKLQKQCDEANEEARKALENEQNEPTAE